MPTLIPGYEKTCLNCPSRDYIDICFLEAQKIGFSEMHNKTPGRLIQTNETFKTRRKRLTACVFCIHFNRIGFIYIFLPDKIDFVFGLASPKSNFLRKIIFFTELTKNTIL
jgi:hypothetical protein